MSIQTKAFEVLFTKRQRPHLLVMNRASSNYSCSITAASLNREYQCRNKAETRYNILYFHILYLSKKRTIIRGFGLVNLPTNKDINILRLTLYGLF